MDELTEGSKVVYQISEKEAKDMTQYMANHPDRQPAGTKVVAGQRVPATVVLTRGPNDGGQERLAVRLDGTTPSEKAYHVWVAELRYADGAWHRFENSE